MIGHTAMITVVILLIIAATLVVCSSEGNIHLLEDEVALVLKTCVNDKGNGSNENRERRSNDQNSDVIKTPNQYNCTSNISDNSNTIEDNNYSYDYLKEKQTRVLINNADMKKNRTKRSEPLFNKPDADQCLSQCVFANLQVVDSRGIPREAELWNIMQSSVTSQQSRAALRDQIRACFQELQTESEDNGCSYSNKLERCLMLRFSDRQNNLPEKAQKSKNSKK